MKRAAIVGLKEPGSCTSSPIVAARPVRTGFLIPLAIASRYNN